MTSWIKSANTPRCPFPVQNLPFGVATIPDGPAVCVTAIGDTAIDLAVLEGAGVFDNADTAPEFANPALNSFMAAGPGVWQAIRARLSDILTDGGDPSLRDNADLRARAMHPMAEIAMQMPILVAEYTDFYASRSHATNVGIMFRGPENALPPNWLHIPIGYNGRASTVVVSGTPIRRPLGQTKPPQSDTPVFGPCRRLDIELELGAIVGTSSKMGEPITVGEADEMIFGYVLLNDWSARDIQAWEYQPLGPFQAKAFATSISPWIVTRAALEPFRVSTPPREFPLLPYLNEPGPMLYDINLEVHMLPAGSGTATRISQTNGRHLYYSAAQQLAHHASSGCKMNTGDLLGSGTISGPDKSQYGSLLEMSWGGKEPIILETGETRTFIEDGDRLTLSGWAENDDFTIGFGECDGTILPAPAMRDW